MLWWEAGCCEPPRLAFTRLSSSSLWVYERMIKNDKEWMKGAGPAWPAWPETSDACRDLRPEPGDQWKCSHHLRSMRQNFTCAQLRFCLCAFTCYRSHFWSRPPLITWCSVRVNRHSSFRGVCLSRSSRSSRLCTSEHSGSGYVDSRW